MAPYSGPVIDTHHHIWLRKDVPWLADPPIPRMFGDYFGLRRDYPVEEWINDIVPQGVTKSVHVTAMWGRAARSTRRAGCNRSPTSTAFRTASSAMPIWPIPTSRPRSRRRSNFPICAACARCCIGTADPMRQAASRPDYCNDPEFRRGFALLEKHDLHFELQVYAGQAKYAGRADQGVSQCAHDPGACRHADTARTPEAINEWRAALTAMAAFPNLHVKLSGLGMFSQGITVPQARQVIRDTIQIFGIERTIYGSNFPLEKLHASYADFFGVYRTVLSEYTEAEQRKVLHDNAVKFYRL